MTLRPGISYSLTTGAASVATPTPTSNGVRIIRLIATADCWVVFGATPVATASGMLVRGGQPAEYFTIHPGEAVAALQVSASGTLNVTEMTS